MATRDHTKAFMTMRDSYIKRDTKLNDTEKARLLEDSTDSANNTVDTMNEWLPLVDKAKSAILSSKISLKKLDKLMINFFNINFDDDNDDDKLKEITGLAKVVTGHYNDAKTCLLQANAVPILKKNKDQISMRKNMINDIVLQLEENTKQFKHKEKTFMSKYKSMTSVTSVDYLNSFENTHGPSSNIEETPASVVIDVQELMTKTNTDIINQRDIEIRQLAGSVQEVSQLFQDLHILVLEQGTTVDSIDHNIMSASHNVESGVSQLKDASKLTKKGRPIRCCILLAVIIIIAIVALTIWLTVSPPKS